MFLAKPGHTGCPTKISPPLLGAWLCAISRSSTGIAVLAGGNMRAAGMAAIVLAHCTKAQPNAPSKGKARPAMRSALPPHLRQREEDGHDAHPHHRDDVVCVGQAWAEVERARQEVALSRQQPGCVRAWGRAGLGSSVGTRATRTLRDGWARFPSKHARRK